MNEKPPKRCGAKTRGTGEPCRRWARPNGRCHLHGGKSKHGADSPNFKHGRYSAYVPDNLSSAYTAARADPELLSMRDNVALLDARAAELLGELSTGAAASKLWDDLSREWGRLVRAIQTDNDRQQSVAIGRLNRIISDGAAASDSWRELYEITERRRRVVETEQRVISTRQTMVTVENVLMYLAVQIEATKNAVRKYVDDVETRRLIIEAAAESNRQLLGGS